MKLLDIFITKDGEKVQPEVPVSVEIKLLDKSEAVTALNQEASDTELEETKDDEVTNTNDPDISMQIIHFAAEGPESLECVNKEETVKFKTSGFSIYAIIGTETGDPS